jgi:hypothetical protein
MFQSASVPPHSFDLPNDEIKNYKKVKAQGTPNFRPLFPKYYVQRIHFASKYDRAQNEMQT